MSYEGSISFNNVFDGQNNINENVGAKDSQGYNNIIGNMGWSGSG